MMPPSSDEEEESDDGRRPMGQNPNAGMMPPSSDEEEYEDEEVNGMGQNPRAGMMPPSSDEEEDESEEEEDDDLNGGSRGAEPEQRARRVLSAEDQELVRRDMERLALVRQKREEDRQKRIREEGWDRFAPVTETNKPPA
ncbi:hypothetical protein NDN08_006045 [Rhodosorus marinus]|uniref:Micro-fibrillar-associated protein 1 C-terminal domain-containing protein n=1 Tax=Rhodosorus marinus TaxID=101924 RepID=A0AAV8UJN3_9RHOD|nr:hypothetical protein NDN08_006045 [Rhodosorus marinus]